MRLRALSISTTSTVTVSPRLTTSSTFFTRSPLGARREMWSRPSVPFLSSTNAPKSVVLTTRPVNTSPTSTSLVIDWMRFLTPSAASSSGAQMKIVPSSWMSMSALNSSVMPRMVSPPLPITSPIWSGLIWIEKMRGAHSLSSLRGSAIASSILPRMWSRALRACSSASVRISNVTPVILMSICRAVMPSAVPATLKSMSPRWSSTPAMSVRTT